MAKRLSRRFAEIAAAVERESIGLESALRLTRRALLEAACRATGATSARRPMRWGSTATPSTGSCGS